MNFRYSTKRCIPAAAAIIIGVAYVDYVTGEEFSLFPLYLIPLAYIAWNDELPAVLGISALAAVSITVKRFLEVNYSNELFRYWNNLVEASFSVLLPFGLWKVRGLLLEKERLNLELQETFADLKHTQEELKTANEALEQMVDERTKDLALTIEALKKEIAERTRLAQVLETETAARLRMQDELHQKELMLMQQSRMAAMGEMIGNIAHQWRQPLNRLALLSQDVLLTHEAGMVDDAFLEEHVAKVMETIEHMSQTVDDFRNFFKLDKEKISFPVVGVIRKTLALLAEGLGQQQIRTEVRFVGDPCATGYPNEYSQVLINILANAKDAFSKRPVTDPRITISAWSDGGKTVVTITDNAGGIPEDVIDRIFDPYFSTKPEGEGTGLGLYMSKIIIEKNLKGTLTVCNVHGGAEFRIEV